MKLIRLLCAVLALLVAASPELLSAPKKTAKKSAATAKKKSASSKSKSRRAAASSRGKASAKKRKPGRSSAPASQRTPEPERIREIQQALTDRGYPVEVNGSWDASSIEALKKFQADQQIKNLSGSGKINSLTLITLGLGPKHESTPPTSPEPNREGQTP